jgi:hypothetical protein
MTAARSDRKPGRDLRIVPLLKDPRANRLDLLEWQLRERPGGRAIASHGRFDPFELLAVKAHRLTDPKSPPGPRLDPAVAEAFRQRVVRNREQPTGGRRFRRPVPRRRAEGGREHFPGQIGHNLGIAHPASEVRHHRRFVSVVKAANAPASDRATRSSSVRSLDPTQRLTHPRGFCDQRAARGDGVLHRRRRER